MPNYNDANKLLGDLPLLLATGLQGPAGRDLCALECYANAYLYAKPDSQKDFILWEMKKEKDNTGEIQIHLAANAIERHAGVIGLFLGKRGIVRFPFNAFDSEEMGSLSWSTIEKTSQVSNKGGSLLVLPRWSTASRSCFVLIPESLDQLASGEYRFPLRRPGSAMVKGSNPLKDVTLNTPINLDDWNNLNMNRLLTVVEDYGKAASENGIELMTDLVSEITFKRAEAQKKLSKGKYRLYSVKTGVTWVGSTNERASGKNFLEHNSALAQVRSDVIQSYMNRDQTFGIQTEVLTVTAQTTVKVEKYKPGTKEIEKITYPRDGFQVRDLSCLRPGLAYIPCQTIPYARASFDNLGESDSEIQPGFWRKAFAIPLGRAKARLFLNFGLIHMSANAQNFLLGFEGANVKQFVARDIGDTSWHDLYIERYFQGAVITGNSTLHARLGLMILDKLREEKSKPADAATLYIPEEGNYPAPQIIRLAAGKALTHGFSEVLEEKHKWSKEKLYEFATGILDGFRDFVQEALFERENLYPAQGESLPDPDEKDEARKIRIKKEYEEIRLLGESGGYPPGNGEAGYIEYKKRVKEALDKDSVQLFKEAALVRQLGRSLKSEEFNDFKNSIDVLIGAEELLLCAGLENRLGISPDKSRDEAIAKKIHGLLGTGRWPLVIKGTEL